MGSWSVYCEATKLSITCGDLCYLVPLKPSDHNCGGYSPYCPLTLPIKGVYDDYGGIEEIIETEHTKLISEHYGVSIDEFCHFFTRGSISPSETVDIPELNPHNFCWLNADFYEKVYKMRSPGFGSFPDFGNQKFLEHFGFEFQGENGEDRFNKVFTKNDVTVNSDGTYLQGSVYDFDNFAAITGIDVSQYRDMHWVDFFEIVGNDCFEWVWRYLGYNSTIAYLAEASDKVIKKKLNKEPLEDHELDILNYENKSFTRLLFNNKDKIHKEAAQLYKFKSNTASMNFFFDKFTPFITPQCGEHREHLELLNIVKDILQKQVEEIRENDPEY